MYFGDMVNSIKDSPYRVRITGDVLGTPTRLVGFKTDNTNYLKFHTWEGTLNDSEFGETFAGRSATFSSNPRERSMSIIAFVFDPTPDTQDYTVTVRASYYTRWPLTTVPGQSMKSMPTADQKEVNRHHDEAEESKSHLKSIDNPLREQYAASS
jgi:hypothetical protein